MPIVTLPTPSGPGRGRLSRRALFAIAGAASLNLGANANEARWALLSDTHIPGNAQEEYRGFKPVVNLTMVVRQLAAANLQGAMICGDLARLEGLTPDYESLMDLIEPVAEKWPLAMALGNHDHRENFLKTMTATIKSAQAVKSRHVVSIDAGPVQLVVLDSLIEANYTPGFLGKAQRDWLKSYLAAGQTKPVVLFVHHTLDDGDGSLHDAPRLLEIAKNAPAVKAIVYGHSHVYKFETWEGVHLINLPAVGYNFRDSEPVGWVETVFKPTGASFTLRAVGGGMEKDGKTTELKWRS